MGAEQSSPAAPPPRQRAVQAPSAAAATAAAGASSRSPMSDAAPRAPGGAPIVSEPDVELQPLPPSSNPPSPAASAAAAPPASQPTIPLSNHASHVPAAVSPPPSVQPAPQPAIGTVPSTVAAASSSSLSSLTSAPSLRPAGPSRQSIPASQPSQPLSIAQQQPKASATVAQAARAPALVQAPAVASSSPPVQPAAPSPPQSLVPVTSVSQPASVVIHPLGPQPLEEKKQEEVKSPEPEAPVEAKEAVSERPSMFPVEQQQKAEAEKQRSTGKSSFWSFLVCGCGTEATDPPHSTAPARPQPQPQSQSTPPPVAAAVGSGSSLLSVVPVSAVQQQQQPAVVVPAAAVEQHRPAAHVAPANVQQPQPQPQPAPSPAQPASVIKPSPAPAANSTIPVASPVKGAPATSATAATSVSANQRSQPTSSATNLPAVVNPSPPSENVPSSDEPVQLMHPVYSHLPLLNIPASALSLYPPHRPPVPDPTEQRAFALQRQLPLPKSLNTPFLLTSLTDPFIPSSTSDHAFQSTADWSYALLLDIQHACRQTREKYFDNSYPPSHESLFAFFEPKFDTPESQLYTEVSGQQFENGVRWCRASEMQKPTFTSYFSSWRVMNDTIAASDVRQGQLGTCYFVAAVCSLVDKYPQFVRSLFLTPDYSSEGVYQIRLCRDGVWRVVTIDDFLPCLTDANWFRFTHAVDAQLWPALLEKAYSKVYGSYKALESGLPHEVLSDLTGSPGFRIDLHPSYVTALGKVGAPSAAGSAAARSAPLSFVDEQSELDVLWLQMLEWKSRGYLFCASCDFSHRQKTKSDRHYQYATSEEAVWDSDEAWQKRYAQMGLVTSHAYSVLDVVEAEGGVRLIKLRNPWARFVWKGQWSRGPQTKEQKEREQAEEKKRAEAKAAEQKRREEAARNPQPKTWKELMRNAMSSVVDSVSDASSSASAYYPAARGPNAAAGVAAVREDKGLFWMAWEDFSQYFSTLYVCQFVSHPEVKWQELRLSDSFAPHPSQQVAPAMSLAAAHSASTPYYSSSPLSPSATVSPSTHTAQFMYELLVSSPTHVFLTLSQPDKRGEPPTLTPQPVYQPLGLHLLQSTNESSALSEGKFSFVPAHFQLIAYKRPFADRQVTLEALLPSITSRYLLLPDTMLYGVARLDYVLALHADRPVYCRRIPLLPNALSVARRLSPPAGNIHASLLSHFPCRVQEVAPMVYLVTYSMPHGGSCYIFQNKHPNMFLHVRFDCSASTRVLCSRPGGVASDVIEPRTEQCVMVVGGVRGAGRERDAEVVVQYTYQFRRENVLPQYSVRTQHHPSIVGLDYHQPRPIVTEMRA